MNLTEENDWDYSDSINGAFKAHEEALAVARLERFARGQAKRFGFTLHRMRRGRPRHQNSPSQYQVRRKDGTILVFLASLDEAIAEMSAAALRAWNGR